VRLMLGDCLERMRELDDGSVDAVVTDPPYFKVKPNDWDNQWRSETEFLDWIGRLCAEWCRLLKPNGSLYVFASTQRSARVEVKISETFNILNRITWRKHDGAANKGGPWCRANKESLRSFFPASESIIFAEHYGADNMAKGEAGYVAKCDDLRGFVFEPLRAYLAGEWERAGLKREDANKGCGTASMASHFFSRSHWRLPTEQHYEALRKYANAQGGEFLRREHESLRREYEFLRREYESLRREYEFLRREYEFLRRPFNVTPDVPYTDIWDFKTVAAYPGKHPCEKPVELMRHIISTSTRPGMTVLDCFMGGGSTGVACALEGREFIGIELDDGYFTAAEQRIRDTEPPVF
jgi:adenine-specific DNA-methyltransferase